MKESQIHYSEGKLWYTRELERTVFFYATIVMFVLWGLSKLM